MNYSGEFAQKAKWKCCQRLNHLILPDLQVGDQRYLHRAATIQWFQTDSYNDDDMEWWSRKTIEMVGGVMIANLIPKLKLGENESA